MGQCPVLVILNLEIGPSFNFPSNEFYIFNQVVSATVTAIAATSAAEAAALSISSGDLAQVLTIIGVGVSSGHVNISFVLYRSMC